MGEALCFHTYDPARCTPAALYRYGIACGKSHNAIAERPQLGGYGAAAWFLLKGMVQMLKGRGDRFRQCIINAGIQMGTRKSIVKDAS